MLVILAYSDSCSSNCPRSPFVPSLIAVVVLPIRLPQSKFLLTIVRSFKSVVTRFLGNKLTNVSAASSLFVNGISCLLSNFSIPFNVLLGLSSKLLYILAIC